MKVLHVLPTLSAGGAEGFVARLLPKLAERHVDVKLFLSGGVRDARGRALMAGLCESGIPVVGSEVRAVKSFDNLRRLTYELKSWRPEILQANLFSSEVLAYAANLASVNSRTKIVRRLANTRLSTLPGGLAPTRWFASRFDGVVACSEPVAEEYRRTVTSRSFVPLRTIRNGISVPVGLADATTRRAARQALGLPAEGFCVLHVGRMTGGSDGSLATSQKAHDILLRSFALGCRRGLQDSFLALVGTGPLLNDIRELAARLEIGDRVFFLGLLEEPWQAFQAANAFFFPSRSEGMPNALVEAACMGLPVVASQIPEIVSLDKFGEWLLSPVDDMEGYSAALLRLRAEAAELPCHAREISSYYRQEFSMSACALEYLSFYESIL